MLKLGAMTTPTSGCADSHSRTRAIRSSSNPVVPTTTLMPLLMHHSRLSSTASGWVKSTATRTFALASVLMSSSTSTAAPSLRSSAAPTARQTSSPMRPFAPRTPTTSGWSGNGRGEAVTSAVIERSDGCQRERSVEDVGGHRAHVVQRHGFDVGEHLVDAQQLALHELALAEPAHPRAGVLQSENQRTAQLTLASRQ